MTETVTGVGLGVDNGIRVEVEDDNGAVSVNSPGPEFAVGAAKVSAATGL